jgi:amino acid transporter
VGIVEFLGARGDIQLKKLFVSAFVVLFSAVGLGFAMPATVSADACQTDVDSSFLNFPTWYRGLCEAGSDKIQDLKDKSPAQFIFTIALNIVDIALRVAAIIAVGFVIFGGFRYVTSQGVPEATKNAQDTIVKAVVGLVIALSAAAAVSFIVWRLNG